MQTLLRHRWWVVLAAAAATQLAGAQVKPIQDNGASEGLSPDVVNFEPEYRDRSARDAGMAVPAAPGTPPSPADPHDLSGVWVIGKTYPISGGNGGGDGPPGGPNDKGPAGNPTYNGVYGIGKRSAPEAVCVPRSAFTMGLPGKVIQTMNALYILRNGQDGTSYRKILLDNALSQTVSAALKTADGASRITVKDVAPKDLKASRGGYSIGFWDGDTLVVTTVGLKGQMSAGDFGGGVGAAYTSSTVVIERIRKIEGNLKLEDQITFVDRSVLKQPYVARIVSYWRPDLKFVEAPCEEYSDPLETETTGPFSGGDEPRRPFPRRPAAVSTPDAAPKQP